MTQGVTQNEASAFRMPSLLGSSNSNINSATSAVAEALISTPIKTPVKTPISTPLNSIPIISTPLSTPLSTPALTPLMTPVTGSVTGSVITPAMIPFMVTEESDKESDIILSEIVTKNSLPFLTDDICLFPGSEPVVRVEEAPSNARRIFTGVDIMADMESIWDVLTTFERLQDVVPSLVKNEVNSLTSII